MGKNSITATELSAMVSNYIANGGEVKKVKASNLAKHQVKTFKKSQATKRSDNLLSVERKA